MKKKIDLKVISDELGLRLISDELGLRFEDQSWGINQDWGIINGSAGRVEEFINNHSSDLFFRPILSYWKRITNEEDFPVGKFL